MTELAEQLQRTLGEAYRLEGELDGAGMSRVFVAEDRALGRKVVVKVLSPQVAGDVNLERFKRETLTAARLQHPHIVPVLSAGEAGGVPFYIMPFVEGESLSARILRAGPLPITEAISLLRDVAQALAYAHEHGVVHRDIKPGNVMLSRGIAVVTDFGIAKAITASRTGSAPVTLTQVDMAIGTPAYMAPEQIAGDPNVDTRADFYALGCTAYEMLTGRPPFADGTPQQILAAHLARSPAPIATVRPDTPPPLAGLVMQCLEKNAAERPASGDEIARALESVRFSSDFREHVPAQLPAAMLKRALLFYAMALVAVAALARLAIAAIGLPEWVFPGSLFVMALGLPVILFTGYVQRVSQRSLTDTPSPHPSGARPERSGVAWLAERAGPFVSWRRAAQGGVFSLVAFVVVVGALMALRPLGIGPAASLIGAGKLSRQDQILVAEFSATGPDSALGPALAEAMRTGLGRSRAIRVVPTSATVAALGRMGQPADARVTATRAREIAMREGIKAVVSGDLLPVRDGYLLTARIVAANNGDVLATYQQSAANVSELIPAIDRLGRSLLGRIGASLRSVQNAPELARVTTASFEALRVFTEGEHASNVEGKPKKAILLLDSAIALDSNFGMAYRKLSIALGNEGGAADARVDEVLSKAYARRDRFGEADRLALMAEYYRAGPRSDRGLAIELYEEVLRKHPEYLESVANNLAMLLQGRHEYARAESLFARVLSEVPDYRIARGNLINAQIAQGKLREAMATAESWEGFPERAKWRIALNTAAGDSATAAYERLIPTLAPEQRAQAHVDLSNIAARDGRLTDWARHRALSRAVNASAATSNASIMDSLFASQIDLWILDRRDDALRRLNATVARMPPERRLQHDIARRYGQVGDAANAKAIAAYIDSATTDTATRRVETWRRQQSAGWIAFAERRYLDAVTEFKRAERLPDGPRGGIREADSEIGLSFDRAGIVDSAIGRYEHFVQAVVSDRSIEDALHLAWILRRLGDLYEGKGAVDSAVRSYRRFLDLWKGADAALNPQIAQVRLRLARLSEAQRKKG